MSNYLVLGLYYSFLLLYGSISISAVFFLSKHRKAVYTNVHLSYTYFKYLLTIPVKELKLT